MSRRVDWNTNEVLSREKPELDLDEAERRLAQLDFKLGVGQGARSERKRLLAVLLAADTPERKPRRRRRR
jgi:hypothetical protein